MNIEYIYRLPLNTYIEYEIINYHIAQPKWPGADGPLGLKALGPTASQPYLSGLVHRKNSTYWVQRVRVSGTKGNLLEKFSNHIYILPKLPRLRNWRLRYLVFLSTIAEKVGKNFPGTSRVPGISFCVEVWYNGGIGKEVSLWRY